MRRTVLGTAAITMAAVLLLAGCQAERQDAAGDVSEARTVNGGDCGRVSLGQGDSVPDANLACFSAAVEAGGPGTLTVVSPTTEGDGIVSTYTVVGPGVVKLRFDTTADKFAGTGAVITEQVCDFRVSGGEIQTDGCTKPVPV